MKPSIVERFVMLSVVLAIVAAIMVGFVRIVAPIAQARILAPLERVAGPNPR